MRNERYRWYRKGEAEGGRQMVLGGDINEIFERVRLHIRTYHCGTILKAVLQDISREEWLWAVTLDRGR